VVADEVDDHQPLFAGSTRRPRPSCWRNTNGESVGRSMRTGVESGQVDAFVEEVDREDDVEIAGIEPLESTTTIGAARTAMNATARTSMLVEERRHELRMRDRATERSVRVLPCSRQTSSSCSARSIVSIAPRELLDQSARFSTAHEAKFRHVALRPVLEPAELASRDALDEPALEDEVVPAQCQEVGTVQSAAE